MAYTIPSYSYDIGSGGTGATGTTLDTLASSAEGIASQGISNPDLVGGLPDYSALIQATQQLMNSRVTLPADLQASIANAGLTQLGANEATTSLQGGDIAAAARNIAGDQTANVALSGNLTKTREAAVGGLEASNQAAAGEANTSGSQASGNFKQQMANRLQQYVQQGMAHHANLSLQNQAQATYTGVQNSQATGMQTAAQQGNSALTSLAQASLANDQAGWGNAMTALRGGLSALGTAAAAATKSGIFAKPTVAVPQIGGTTLDPNTGGVTASDTTTGTNASQGVEAGEIPPVEK